MKRNLILVSLVVLCITVSQSNAAFYEVYGRLCMNVDSNDNNRRNWSAVMKIGDVTAGKYLTCFKNDIPSWLTLLPAYNYSELINLSSAVGLDYTYIDNPPDLEGYKAGLVQLMNHTHKIARYLQDLGHQVRIYYAPITTIDYLKRANDIPTGVRISTADFDAVRTKKNTDNLSILECTVNQLTAMNSSLVWSTQTAATKGTAITTGSGTSATVNYTAGTSYAGTDSFVINTADTLGGTASLTVNMTTPAQSLNHYKNKTNPNAGYNILQNVSYSKADYVFFSFSPDIFNTNSSTKTYSVVGMPTGIEFLPTYRLFRNYATQPVKPYYVITVTANDGISKDSLTFTLKFANVNDSGVVVPKFSAPNYTYNAHSIKENSAIGTPLTPDTAITVTTAGTPAHKYRIVDGNHNGIFEINETTGRITVANPTNLKLSFEGILPPNDFNSTGYHFRLTVEAYNTSTYQEYSNATTVNITVTP